MSLPKQPVETIEGVKKLFGRNVLVKLDPLRDESKGGILLPKDTNSYEELRYGVVVDASKGWYDDKGRFIPLGVQPGDRIVCAVPVHNPCEVMINGVRHNIIKEDFIYGHEE